MRNTSLFVSGSAVARDKSEDKGAQWTLQGQCSRGDTCELKHDPEKKRSSSPRRNLERGTCRQESLSGKENELVLRASPRASLQEKQIPPKMLVIVDIHRSVFLVTNQRSEEIQCLSSKLWNSPVQEKKTFCFSCVRRVIFGMVCDVLQRHLIQRMLGRKLYGSVLGQKNRTCWFMRSSWRRVC